MIETIRKELILLAEEDYKKFSSSLIPNVTNMYGIRIPKLRNLAKRIAKENFEQFLAEAGNESFEEIMLHGMVIGYAKMDLEKRLSYLDEFVPKINNWSVCDSCCMTYKFIQKNPDVVWQYIQKYLYSKKEFYIRFGVVILLAYYIIPSYIDKVLSTLDKLYLTEYYAQMSVAWAVSVCYVKFPNETKSFLSDNNLDDFTFNKSIQKICESYRVNQEDKELLKLMKRK